jgi:hypothetical protein
MTLKSTCFDLNWSGRPNTSVGTCCSTNLSGDSLNVLRQQQQKYFKMKEQDLKTEALNNFIYKNHQNDQINNEKTVQFQCNSNIADISSETSGNNNNNNNMEIEKIQAENEKDEMIENEEYSLIKNPIEENTFLNYRINDNKIKEKAKTTITTPQNDDSKTEFYKLERSQKSLLVKKSKSAKTKGKNSKSTIEQQKQQLHYTQIAPWSPSEINNKNIEIQIETYRLESGPENYLQLDKIDDIQQWLNQVKLSSIIKDNKQV